MAENKDEGKYTDLPGNVDQIVVRFPPEASGYLHIGHAKAALLNQRYQLANKGKLVFRFDDTNPEKEKEDFEQVIREDVKLLEIQPDICSHTSDHFEIMMVKCEDLISRGLAFVDDTPAEQMKSERETRTESKNRNNSVEENLKLWNEMKKGSDVGKKCCVRAKIDMNSNNGCMRDPTIYRCKEMAHPKTGNKYKVYPTYDFACPIVDSLEGVTHALRTTEYEDRDEQFAWFIKAMGLREVYIVSYARLNMMNTVLSKRKLTWFVEQGIVDGWDDPRMPTVRGILRHGLTVEGLKQFIVAQGSSRSVVFMDWDKIWSFNRKILDATCIRLMGIEEKDHVTLNLNCDHGTVEIPAHPKRNDLPALKVSIGPKILIEQIDCQQMKEGDKVTMMGWGNMIVTKMVKDANGKVISVDGKLALEDKDYKKTLKIAWLKGETAVKAKFIYYEHLLIKSCLGKEDDFKDFINKDNVRVVDFLVSDTFLSEQKKGKIFQFLKRGYFIVDSEYDNKTIPHIGMAKPAHLISIPDGTTDLNIYPTEIQEWKKKIREETARLAQDVPKGKSKKGENAKKMAGDAQQQPHVNYDDIDPASDLGIVVQALKVIGDNIRLLKASNADKKIIAENVKILLLMKDRFKSLSGKEYVAPPPPPPTVAPKDQPKSSISSKSVPKFDDNNKENEISKVNQGIKTVGDNIRQLKADKADKKIIQENVQILLDLKSRYKQLTGTEWAPQPANQVAPSSTTNEVDKVNQQIKEVGDVIRQLKADKADKEIINEKVKSLLTLKAKFQELTGTAWSPTSVSTSSAVLATPQQQPVSSSTDKKDESTLLQEIKEVGDNIRQLKSSKADKKVITDNVNILLELKGKYKELTGKEWTPGAIASAPTTVPSQVALTSSVNEADKLNDEIKKVGDIIRQLKAEKADKQKITSHVNSLLELKGKYKELTGKDWVPPPASSTTPASTPAKKDAVKSDSKPKPPKEDKKSANKKDAVKVEVGAKKQTRLGIEAAKSENLADWYTEVITKSEMIEYYDVSGCYILRPWAFAIWEMIQKYLDDGIKTLGVENVYFPMFVSQAALEKEKTHIEDFAPEVAWVTKSGQSELAEPIAIRPTSETVMYPSFAKWCQSHRSLPIKVNQWCNVIRWEFKNPTPFLRTREFLWQEGHTAHAEKEDAVKEVHQVLDLYASTYEHLLAVPVIKGKKTEKEKFAGSDFTTTIEGYIGANGRGIQAATSHHLGQNFSKMFEIIFEDPNEAGKKLYAYQNSWGFTTRSVGVMIIVHSDDKGLVLPPNIAPYQVVIVPCGITATTTEEEKNKLIDECNKLNSSLSSAKIRTKSDLNEHYSPGWKFNHWELKGVPIRIELGPKDLSKRQFVVARRDTGIKETFNLDNAVESISKLLETIQKNLFDGAKKNRDEHLAIVTEWESFLSKLDDKCLLMAPFCGDPVCEETIKKNSSRVDQSDVSGPLMGAKSLCIPFDQPSKIDSSMKCINPHCKGKPQFFTLFGRSY